MIVKPSILHTMDRLLSQLKEVGLTEDDVIGLIQTRTYPKLPRDTIKNTMRALKKLESHLEGRKA